MLPIIENEVQFNSIRDKLLAQPSIKQMVVNKRADTVGMVTNVVPVINNQTLKIPSIETHVKKEAREKLDSVIFVHCKHEARLVGLKREIHEIHDSFFKDTPHGDIRLIVGHQNNSNIDFALSEKRPRPLLILKDPSK